MAAPDLLPGDLIRITHPWNMDGSPVLAEGQRALVISTGGVFASQNEALLLTDDRLVTVADWWLRLHCNVLNERTADRPCPGHLPGRPGRRRNRGL